MIRDCLANGNGDGGIIATPGKGTVSNCLAKENGGHGIDPGSNSILRGSVAGFNQGIGLNVGDTCIAESCLATSNMLDGIRTNDRAQVRGCVSGHNGGNGIRAQHNCFVFESIVTNNGGFGIEATATETRIEANHLLENAAGGVQLTGCGHLVVRNSGGNSGPNNCVTSNLDSLFPLSSGNHVGHRVNQPGGDFVLDAWANIGL